jgi:hypothetical protein
MVDLPKHIADMCGIIEDTEVVLGWGRSTVRNPVHTGKDKDGCYTITYNGEAVGWITPITVHSRNGHKFRAVSVHGAFKHTYSVASAREFIMEEMA